MKAIFLALLLLVSSVTYAEIIPETAANNQGQVFIRLYNNTPMYVSCYYRDNYNYFTFSLSPNTYSMWYPTYGYYEWYCE